MDDTNFVGVFGYGRFGKFLCDELRRAGSGNVRIRVYDPVATRDAQAAPKFAETWSARATGKAKAIIEFVSAPEAARGAIVVFAVPISELKAAVLAAAPFMSEGAIVMDACSVKIKPLEVMKLLLPSNVEILGAHPLFGPDSAQANRGIRGLKVVLCPVRITAEHAATIRGFLEKAGLKVIETTPEAHDRAMAESQALFHLIARAVQELESEKPASQEIITPGPSRLFEDLKILQNDTVQLFLDIQRENPFAREIRQKFIDRLAEINRDLNQE
ncbi:MAG: prephenate dehydrogenase [Acidobacteriia bacterium]|nr:prephenate dehydrogenase [Terriglobia bacterium]